MLTETQHAAGALVSESNGTRSRENITILAGSGAARVLLAGQSISKLFAGTGVSAADAGNTGDGTMGALTVGARAKVGAYELVCIEPATDAGMFLLTDPDGVVIGVATVASAFTSLHLSFTLADGSANFIAGDRFTLTVTEGASKWLAFDQDLTTGEQFVDGILRDDVTAPDAVDATGVAYVRDCEFNGGEIVWPADITGAEQTEAEVQLAKLGIIAR